MGLLDPLFGALQGVLEFIDDIISAINNPDIDGQQASQVIGQTLEAVQPSDELGGALVDTVEEFVVAELSDAGELKPENAEGVADDTEGAATNVLAGFGLAASAVEAASLGQVDQHTEYITQALAGLGVDDVTGMELDARVQEGLMPALEAKYSKQHRAKFVDLADAVEYLLRFKTADRGFLQGNNIPQAAYGKIQSNTPVNPQNALEEWGIRDDQLDVLEEVSISVLEPEELIETPAELGLLVDQDTLDRELDRAGLSEDVKALFSQIPDAVRRSNRLWEEKAAVDPVVTELDTLVQDGEVSPGEAGALLPDEADEAQQALIDRYSNLDTLPNGTPSRSQIEGAFARGYIDVDEFEDFLDRTEFDADDYQGVLKAAVLDELDGDLQESVALGLVSETRYSNLAGFVGLDQEATDALLAGQSLGDITDRRLKEQQDPTELPVGAIQGIGESRSQSLQAIGIETVGQLAQADTETVADATQVSPDTANGWISQAQQLTE